MTKHRSNSERRLYPRIPVDLLGELRIGGRDSLSCRIRNICQDGLLLECAESEQTQSLSNAQILIRFSLPHHNGSNLIQAWIQLLSRSDGFFGARFLRLDTQDASTLQTFIKAPFSTTANAIAGSLTQTARTILRRITLRCLDDLTKPLIDQIQAILLAISERAINDLERADINSDIIKLDRAIKQRRFQEQLRRELLDNLVQLEKTSSIIMLDKGFDSKSLALIDQEGFDLWLAVSALVERLERYLDTDLLPLRTISIVIFGNGSVLSIEPQGLAQALRNILAGIGISTRGQLLCLRAAAKPLSGALTTYYQSLTEAWSKAGLTPQALPRLQTVSTENPPPPIAEKKVATPPAILPVATPVIPQQLPVTISSDTLSSMLAAQTTIPAPGESLHHLLKNLLSQQLPGSPTVLPLVLDDRVKITDQVLNRMSQDQAVPSQAKDLIQNLSMRFLAAAIDDPSFFTAIQHPMTDLFNQIEHLSMFLPPKGNARTPTQQAIERLMQQTLATHPKNITALQELSLQLTDFQRNLDEEWHTNIEQLIVNCDSREQMRQARYHVRIKLNITFAGKPMHPAIVELTRNAWRTLLQLTWIKEQGEGAKWQYYWQILLDLHSACSDKTQILIETQILELLKAVREGLRLIGFDPYQRAILDERIEAALRMARFFPVTELIKFETIPPHPSERSAIEEVSLPTELDTPEGIAAISIVEELEIGTSLFMQQGDTSLRLNLIWRSGDGKELVFIDPSTFQTKTLHRITLARAINSQTVTIQPTIDRPLISRTTEATIQDMQERINYHETHDTLTGLRNRRQFNGILTQVLSAPSNTHHYNTAFTNHVLGFLDIDKFDALTSSCGYSAGERLLVTIANSLENLLEENNPACLAYLGGSRFGFLLPTPTENTAMQLGQQLLNNITATPFYWRGTAYPPSASIGLVMITKDAENPESLLSSADTACVTIQRNGGGQVMLFREGDVNISHHQKQMRNWIQAEATLKGQHIRLRGQRIAATSTPAESPHHYEILLSVYDDKGNSLPLENFISAAEAFNLMLEIDRLVLAKALEWVHSHPKQAKSFGGVAINLSGQSMGDNTLVQIIKNDIERLAIPPELISFEVTETSAIANLDQAAAIIAGIKSIGCHFALDDFGAGMSSYTYLKRLPVDYLKIDGSFIKDILKNPNDQVIVKSINDVAHFMGKQTIAEYVENLEILERLRDIGVDYVQGYAVGKPIFLDEMG